MREQAPEPVPISSPDASHDRNSRPAYHRHSRAGRHPLPHRRHRQPLSSPCSLTASCRASPTPSSSSSSSSFSLPHPRLAGIIVNRAGEKWLIAAIVLVVFLLRWGYYTVFEAFWNGQTPGKKLCKLRVIRDSGRQITFFESLTRNLIRVVDSLPGFYAIGIVTMLCNRRSKRLGDFAAGTLVVHERAPEPPLWGGSASRTITAGAFAATPAPPPVVDPNAVDLPADAVARLTADDLNVIDHFFARAIDIDIARRRPSPSASPSR